MGSRKISDEYFNSAISNLKLVKTREKEKITSAADLIAQSLITGGVLHVFGAGHSHMLAEEVCRRAGGLVQVNPILDIGFTLLSGLPARIRRLERLEGYTRSLVESYELLPNEVIIIASQSGINPAPIEVALASKEQGLYVVSITSLDHSMSLKSRHSSGKRLFEISDVVIDTHVPPGDAVLELSSDLPRIAPLSTVIGATIMQAIIAEVICKLIENGEEKPDIWASANMPGGDEHNRTVAKKYPFRYKSF